MTETTTQTATEGKKTKELVFAHIELMNEEGIKEADLPKEIRQKIRGFNMQIPRYNKKPTENLFNSLQKQTVQIADMIQDWMEKDIKEEEEKQEPTPPPVEDKEAQVRAKLVDNTIDAKELKAIIGKLNVWSGREKVGKLVLVRDSFSDTYRVR